MKPLLYRVLSLYRYLYVLAILGIEISQIPHTSSIPFWTYRVGLHFLIASISRIDIYPSTLLLCSLMRYRSETWLSVYRFHSVVYRNLKWDFYDHLRSDNFCIVVNNHFTLQVSTSGVGKGAHPVCLNIFFRLFGCSCSLIKNSIPKGEKYIGHLLPWLTFSLFATIMHVKLVLTFKKLQLWTQWTISLFQVS